MFEATKVFAYLNLICKKGMKNLTMATKENTTSNEICSLFDVYHNNNKTIKEISVLGLSMVDSLIYNLNVLKKKECVYINQKDDHEKSEIVISTKGARIIQGINQKFSVHSDKLSALYKKCQEIEKLLDEIGKSK